MSEESLDLTLEEEVVCVSGSVDRRKPPQRRELRNLGKVQYVKRKVDNACLNIWDKTRLRVLFLLSGLVFFALLIWSLLFRFDRIDQFDELIYKREQARNEYTVLQEKWQAEHYNALHQKIGDSYRHIIPGYQSLAKWIKTKSQEAKGYGLLMSYTLSDPVRVQSVRGLLSVNMNLSLKREDLHADNGYVGSLAFFKRIMKENWRMEFSSVRMKSDERGVEQTDANIKMWVWLNRGVPGEDKSNNLDVAAYE